MAAPRPDPLVSYHPQTRTLIVTDGCGCSCGSLDEMEAHARAILREIGRQMLARYESAWPRPPDLIPEF